MEPLLIDMQQFFQKLNETWQNGRYEDLYDFYHEDVVMLPPGAREPIVGVEPMVESYRHFGAIGTIHTFDIKKPAVYDFGQVVMCHVPFYIDYEIEAGRFQEEGLEVYAVDKSRLNPKIVWRTQLPMKAENT